MAVVIGCAGSFAQAADDDDDELARHQDLPRHPEGPWAAQGRGTGIEYRERSPLVLPPSKELAARRKPTPPPRRPPAGRTIPTSSGSSSAKRRSASARASRTGRGRQAAAAQPDDGSNAPATAGSKAGEAPGKSAEESAAPSTNAELGSKGFTSMFGWLWAPKEEYTPFTGEPPRSQPDRAAGRIPDALAHPALWRRQGEVDARRSIDKNEPVK